MGTLCPHTFGVKLLSLKGKKSTQCKKVTEHRLLKFALLVRLGNKKTRTADADTQSKTMSLGNSQRNDRALGSLGCLSGRFRTCRHWKTCASSSQRRVGNIPALILLVTLEKSLFLVLIRWRSNSESLNNQGSTSA